MDYYNKYIKYKNKYLKLQNEITNNIPLQSNLIGGGSRPHEYEWIDSTIMGITFSKKKYDYNQNYIPPQAKNWVKNQINFYNNSSQEIKNLIILLTEYSMKTFNIIEDPPKNLKTLGDITTYTKMLELFSKNKMIQFNKQIKDYAIKSPTLDKNITVFSGRANVDSLPFINKKFITSNRFWATTFDKQHANLYSLMRNIKDKQQRKKPFIVFNIIIPKGTNNVFYYQQENQIIILPGTKFEIIKKPYFKKEYIKDIADIKKPDKRDLKLISNWFLKIV